MTPSTSHPRYRIRPAAPRAHRFEVEVNVPQPDPAGQGFRFTAWIRGSYRIRDFAKHRVGLALHDGEGQAVPVEWQDKGRFKAAPAKGPLTLRYAVYAFDESVRKAFLTTERGFFNPGSLCVGVVGQEHQPLELDLLPPDDPHCVHWRVATSLLPVAVDAAGFGRYRAESYEDLLDHPVELGAFERVDFEVDGMPHALVLSGHAPVDTARVTADLARICRAAMQLFGGEPRLDRYYFLTRVLSRGYGGLEHRHSTALHCSREDLPRPGETGTSAAYRRFLGLASHEYFHLWNVKRLTPRAFAESDLMAEAYSRDLWHYEGITSYYDDLLLLRAGLIPAEDYLDLLAQQLTRLWRTPGRLVHTLEQASFEAWTQYYQPDENTPNQTVSYYVKGAVVALLLDLQLRQRGGSLDAVLRGLWERHGRVGEPLPERALETVVCAEFPELASFFELALRSTQELPVAEALAGAGVRAELRPAFGSHDDGGRGSGAPPRSDWGLSLAEGTLDITQVRAGSAAEMGDLSVQDRLVAVDGWALEPSTARAQLAQCVPGVPVAVHRIRNGRLAVTEVVPQPPPLDTWTLTLDPAPSAEAAALRRAWLGV